MLACRLIRLIMFINGKCWIGRADDSYHEGWQYHILEKKCKMQTLRYKYNTAPAEAIRPGAICI